MITRALVGISIRDSNGSRIVSMANHVQNVPAEPGPSKCWQITVDLGNICLNAGTYILDAYFGDSQIESARFSNAFALTIDEHDVFGWGRALPAASDWGPFYWTPDWTVTPAQGSAARIPPKMLTVHSSP
jgi:hypothetical protein